MDTKALRQKILDLAIHGKLVPQDPNDEPASVLLERIKAEKERLIKQGKIKRSKKSAKTADTPHYENVPFEVPESWVWVTLKEITSTIGDGLHGTPQYNSEGDYFFINGNNLSNRKIVIKNETKRVSVSEYEKYKKPLNRSSILVSINGTIGNIGIYDGEKIMLGKSACYMNMVSPINIQYICIILESQYFLKYAIDSATGSTIKNVPLKAINNFKLPFPPISEQQRIVAEIEQWFALIDQIEQEKSDLQTIIKQTKSKILDLAIHGKLVPQDPNDEPAIELLKRINPNFTPCDNGHSEKFPQDWEHILIGDYVEAVTDFVASGSFASLRENVKYYNEPNYAILVRTKDFQNNFKQDLVYTDQHGYDFLAKSNLFGGELIFSNVGSIGKIFIVPELNQKMTLAPNAIMVRFHNDKQQKWFYYLFSSTTGQSLLDSITSATAIGKFNKTDFKKLPIPIPPLAEQQRIVQKIEELFSVLDNIQNALEV